MGNALPVMHSPRDSAVGAGVVPLAEAGSDAA